MFLHHQIEVSNYNRFRITVSPETTKEMLLDSRYYRDIIKHHKLSNKTMFSFGDILEVQAEDGSFYAELFISGSNTEELFVKLNYLTNHDKKGKELEIPSYKIEWKGPKNKFAIIRKTDNSIFKQNFSSKEEAHSFLQNIPA
jgi:hypothetical protein